jgi:hypothetical protein
MSTPHQSPANDTPNQRRKPPRVTYRVLAGNPRRRLAAQRGRDFEEDGLDHDDQREEQVVGDSDEESDSELTEDSDEEPVEVEQTSQGALAEQLYLPSPVFASDDEEIIESEDYEEDSDEWDELSDQSDDESHTEVSSDTEASEDEETNYHHNSSL